MSLAPSCLCVLPSQLLRALTCLRRSATWCVCTEDSELTGRWEMEALGAETPVAISPRLRKRAMWPQALLCSSFRSLQLSSRWRRWGGDVALRLSRSYIDAPKKSLSQSPSPRINTHLRIGRTPRRFVSVRYASSPPDLEFANDVENNGRTSLTNNANLFDCDGIEEACNPN